MYLSVIARTDRSEKNIFLYIGCYKNYVNNDKKDVHHSKTNNHDMNIPKV